MRARLTMVLILLGFLALAPATFAGGGHDPVTICHHAGPNPEDWHTITVDDDSVTLTAHLSHGDTLGPCTVTATPTPTVSPTVTASPSVSTPTPTPTVPSSGEPSDTPTSTSTPPVRPTPTVVGLPVESTLPPTDTSTTTDSRPINWGRALAWLILAAAVGLLTYRVIKRRTER